MATSSHDGPAAPTIWEAWRSECPSRQLLARVGDKWSILVISVLQADGRLRFSQLRRAIEGITQKMLTQTLRVLERDGLVSRTAHPTVPVTVEYELTGLGHSLAQAVAVLRDWAYAHMPEIEQARSQFDATRNPVHN